MRWSPLLLLLGCTRPEPARPTAIQAVSVAPQSTGSPNEPTLLLGKPLPVASPGDTERVKVSADEPDATFKPPPERCPEGINEMMSTHLRLGETMELASGASPVFARGGSPDAIEITFDRSAQIVRATARANGLVFLVVARDRKCTLYGINGGY